jgi:peroxiredoxin
MMEEINFDFCLKDVSGEMLHLDQLVGKNGFVVAFICNHCPYVTGIVDELVAEAGHLQEIGVNLISICSNDAIAYPADDFKSMKKFAKKHKFQFPYLHDEHQIVAKQYGAECTPDFFGFNANKELQYRGRLNAKNENLTLVNRELFNAMKLIGENGQGPKEQYPSFGCSIKWKRS